METVVTPFPTSMENYQGEAIAKLDRLFKAIAHPLLQYNYLHTDNELNKDVMQVMTITRLPHLYFDYTEGESPFTVFKTVTSLLTLMEKATLLLRQADEIEISEEHDKEIMSSLVSLRIFIENFTEYFEAYYHDCHTSGF